jgi:hypothetical protein
VAVHIECNAGGYKADVAPAETDGCPACGAIEDFDVNVTLGDSAEVHESLRIKGYDEHGKKLLDAKSGDSYFRKDGEWHDVNQVVDRSERRYRKKVVRKSTGEVLGDEDVPLDKHEPTAVKRRREVTAQ